MRLHLQIVPTSTPLSTQSRREKSHGTHSLYSTMDPDPRQMSPHGWTKNIKSFIGIPVRSFAPCSQTKPSMGISIIPPTGSMRMDNGFGVTLCLGILVGKKRCVWFLAHTVPRPPNNCCLGRGWKGPRHPWCNARTG